MIVPAASDQPLTIVEFQLGRDETVYQRLVTEMAVLQGMQPGRKVQGLIFFGYNELDPRTEPWTAVVRSFVLPKLLEALEQEQPGHPLVAVFKPLFIESDEVVERERRCIIGRSNTAICRRIAGPYFRKYSSVGWDNGSSTKENRRPRPCYSENCRLWKKPNSERT